MKLKKFARILPIFAVFFLLFCSKISASPDENAWQAMRMGGYNPDVLYQIKPDEKVYTTVEKGKGLFSKSKKKEIIGTTLYVKFPEKAGYFRNKYRCAHELHRILKLSDIEVNRVEFIDYRGNQAYLPSKVKVEEEDIPVLKVITGHFDECEVTAALIILGFARYVDIIDKENNKIEIYGEVEKSYFIFNVENKIRGNNWISFKLLSETFERTEKGNLGEGYSGHYSRNRVGSVQARPFKFDSFLKEADKIKYKIEELEIEKQKLKNTWGKKLDEIDESRKSGESEKEQVLKKLTRKQREKIKEINETCCDAWDLREEITDAEREISFAKTQQERYLAVQNYENTKRINEKKIFDLDKWINKAKNSESAIRGYFKNESNIWYKQDKKSDKILYETGNIKKRIKEIEKEIDKLKELQGI